MGAGRAGGGSAEEVGIADAKTGVTGDTVGSGEIERAEQAERGAGARVVIGMLVEAGFSEAAAVRAWSACHLTSPPAGVARVRGQEGSVGGVAALVYDECVEWLCQRMGDERLNARLTTDECLGIGFSPEGVGGAMRGAIASERTGAGGGGNEGLLTKQEDTVEHERTWVCEGEVAGDITVDGDAVARGHMGRGDKESSFEGKGGDGEVMQEDVMVCIVEWVSADSVQGLGSGAAATLTSAGVTRSVVRRELHRLVADEMSNRAWGVVGIPCSRMAAGGGGGLVRVACAVECEAGKLSPVICTWISLFDLCMHTYFDRSRCGVRVSPVAEGAVGRDAPWAGWSSGDGRVCICNECSIWTRVN